MNRRSITIAAGLCILIALGVAALTGGSPGTVPEEVPAGDPLDRGEQRIGTEPALRTPDKPRESAPPAVPEKTWWHAGTVKSLVADPGTVVVEAHWYRTEPAQKDAKPDAIYDSAPLTFENGEAEYRVEGEEHGWTRLFLREGKRLTPADPFVAHPLFHEVTPGRGWGQSRPATAAAGTRTIRGLVHDKGDVPIPGAKLWVGEQIEDQWLGRNVVSDAEGRFVLAGSRGGPFRVSYNGVAQYQNHTEFIPIQQRVFTATEESELPVLLQRNPRVTLRGRVKGYPHASVALTNIMRHRLDDPDNRRWSKFCFTGGLHLVVTPGQWRLTPAGVTNATVEPATTAHLALDDALDLDTWVTPQAHAALLRVIPLAPGVGPQARMDLAVQAETQSGGFSGWVRSYDTTEALIIGSAQTLNVRAAIRIDEKVWISGVETVELTRGEMRVVALPMEPAVAIHVEAVPPNRHGYDHMSIEGPRFGDDMPVEAVGWQMTGLGVRTKDTTWWCRPGAYVLVLEKRDRSKLKLPLEIEAGQAAHVSWVPGGLAVEVR